MPGSIQGMITTLNNNKKLLRSKRFFKKERTFLNLKKEYLKAAEGELNIKKASTAELALIREKLIRERKKDNIITIIISIILFSVMIYFVINLIEKHNIAIKNQQILEFKENEKVFLSLINDGDEWFKKGKWNHSIFFYKKAKEMFPKNYDINYRLVRSYTFQCESEFKNCHEAKKGLDNLFLMFPEKENELLEIKDKLEYEY